MAIPYLMCMRLAGACTAAQPSTPVVYLLVHIEHGEGVSSTVWLRVLLEDRCLLTPLEPPDTLQAYTPNATLQHAGKTRCCTHRPSTGMFSSGKALLCLQARHSLPSAVGRLLGSPLWTPIAFHCHPQTSGSDGIWVRHGVHT